MRGNQQSAKIARNTLGYLLSASLFKLFYFVSFSFMIKYHQDRMWNFKMKKSLLSFHRPLLVAAALALPLHANAAGTYYTGPYQSPQYRYGQSAQPQPAYASSLYQPQPASQFNRNAVRTPAQQPTAGTAKKSTSKEGFYINGGISREVAEWRIDMKKAGSILHYDNLSWNTLDVNAGYNFGMLKLDGGLKYGMQAGDSPMIDDDMTNGGQKIKSLYYDHDKNGSTPDEFLGDIYGQAISVGTTSGGSMLGFNLGLGLMDKLNFGKMKLTPSVGYRHFSHSLKTEKNFGLSMDTGYCLVVDGTDETQCSPLIMVDTEPDGIPDSAVWQGIDNTVVAGDIDLGNTFYFRQGGTSHKYDTSWSGPYLALDADYEINQNNAVSARIELGLPAYTSTGDQPYRSDWAHPKSVEDSAGIGDAYHLGLNADWKTALTDTVMLSIGFSYDYYTVSGATAKTFMNRDFYMSMYQGASPEDIAWLDSIQQACPNFVCSEEGEIDSFYKSMGIRVGIAAKF
jgi:hypothetical protein